MTDKYSLEVLRRVYDDSEGVYFEICPDADTSTCVEVRVLDKKSIEFYGDIRFALTPAHARQIAKALVDCAAELEMVAR